MLLYKKGELTTLQALIGLLLAIPVLYLLFKVGGIVLTLISTGDDNSFIDFTERISKMNVNTVEDVKLEVNNGNIILAFDSNADSFKSSFGNYNRPTSCLFEMKEKRTCICKCKKGDENSCFKGALCVILSDDIKTISGNSVKSTKDLKENKFYIEGETNNIFRIKKDLSSVIVNPLLIK